MEKRVVILFAVLALLFTGILLRAGSLAGTGALEQAAAAQGGDTLEVYHSRGMIYDCRGEALVNRQVRYTGAVLPGLQNAPVLQSLIPSREQWLEKLKAGRPFLLDLPDQAVSAPGMEVFSVPVRYGGEKLAVHTIGYLNGAGEGVTGVELACNSLLSAGGEEVFATYQVDALGRGIGGAKPEIRRDGEQKSGVRLTLDRRIQEACESAMRQYVKRGAAIVMEAATGKLRAVVSLPDYDPTQVEETLGREDGPLVNRAFSAWAVGSTFKLLTAAAALENGIEPQRRYECKGYIDVDGQIFRCNNWAGHGEITMEEAIMYSCNTYFINLALDLGGETLRETALNMGFSRGDRLAEGLETAAGNLPGKQALQNPAEVANFGFGQGLLTATPLQIAKMTAVFANEGGLVTPSLIEGTVDGAGVLTPAQDYSLNRAVSPQTARVVAQAMRLTVEEGTGVLAAPERGGAGGKTASAQTGVMDGKTGEEIVHAWFSGFYPAAEPQYVIVVMIENGQSGNRAAAPVFKEIADRMEIALRGSGAQRERP
ncbi:MAG: penicillin-binding protein 2 [Oscillospiraceae bacterium]|nr:penicillin-binding protein 2 [Oscillospiraceae bacterium]